MSLKLEYYSDIHIGLKRANNQDSVLVDSDHNIFAVADGLGGHLGGEVASAMALATLRDSIVTGIASSVRYRSKFILKKAFKAANKEIYDQSQQHESLKGMGTTMVSLWSSNEKIYIGHVGDSRAYLYKDSKLWQLTSDHVLLREVLKSGFEHQKEVALKLNSNPLTNSVGFVHKVEVDVLVREAVKGDTFLLCSDGLHGMVSDDVILDIFQSEELKNIPTKCIIKALAAGGYDNVSVVVVKVLSC